MLGRADRFRAQQRLADARKEYDEGQALFGAKQYEDARERFREAIKVSGRPDFLNAPFFATLCDDEIRKAAKLRRQLELAQQSAEDETSTEEEEEPPDTAEADAEAAAAAQLVSFMRGGFRF